MGQTITSFPNIIEKPFCGIFEEFINLQSKANQENSEKFILFFYKECQKEKEIFENQTNTVHFSKLEIKHMLKIQAQIELLIKHNQLEKIEALIFLDYLTKFCKFLTKKDIAKIYYKKPQKNVESQNTSIINSPILLEFENFMKVKNYALATSHGYVTSVKCFLDYSNYNSQIQNSNIFWSTCVNQFEDYLNKKVLLEKIEANTAYAYLKAIRLFIQFLFEKRYISFQYQIPKRMIQKGKRSNEYVNIQDALLVMDKIFEVSNDILRDISIFLLLLETGCRPIELVNLNIDDIYIHEKLIVLKSIKSHQRTLSLSESTINIIKDYLQIRKNYLPKETQALYLSPSGTRMSSEYITNLFRKYNFLTFKEIRFTPKSFRHTFITNAINNNNNIDQVKTIVGHKHLISTHYYYYRDINKIKSLFIGKKLFNGGGNDHDN
ncbi:site-specific integrase [Paenisporosarcina sp. FSL H8-0542]|uniref:tyrosine-type recombinase/integrase n=1 Tax=Paenisporosarcina sp. FSL H8-0542 TaxID=2921401 RepID=UPI003159CD5F